MSVLPPAVAQAQTNPSMLAAGRGIVSSFMGRMVRINGRANGYGFIVGSRDLPSGGTRLVVVTADHLVRDPASSDPPPPVSITFYGNLALISKAEVLPQHLPPDQGDLAILLTERPFTATMPLASTASTPSLLPGSPAWEIGRPGVWEPPAEPGRFSIRQPTGWLLFDGLDAERGSAGGAIVTAQGLAGMVVGEAAGPAAPTRVLPIELVAAKLAEWNLKSNLAAPAGVTPPKVAASGGLAALTFAGVDAAPTQSSPADTDAAAGGVAAPRQQSASLARPPANLGLIPLLSSDAAARRSWFPADARLSPLANVSSALLSSPRREATRIGALPPGRILPPDVWQSGAYKITDKLDGGAWFLAASEGQPLGYVVGEDMIEIWPASSAPPEGRVVRDWTLRGSGASQSGASQSGAGQTGSNQMGPNQMGTNQAGAERHAVLRDAGSHYDLTVPVVCPRAFCDNVSFYTPSPPAAGAMLPSFGVPPVTGSWGQNQIAEVHLLLPRRVVETPGARLMACIGQGAECIDQQILP